MPKLSDSEVKEKIRTLLRGCFLEDYIRLVREAQLRELDPAEVVREAVDELSLVLYRNRYDSHVPHSVMALAASLEVQPYLDEAERMVPVLEALWYAGEEEKLRSYYLPEASLGIADFSAEGLRAVFQSRDVISICAALREAGGSGDRFLAFRDALLAVAWRDLGCLGHKLLYAMKCVELMEMLEGADPVKFLFPAIHFLVHGPRETEYASLLENRIGQRGLPAPDFLPNTGKLSGEEIHRLERVVMFQYPALIIENFLHALEQGIAPEELFQVSLSAGGQLLVSAYAESWIFPVHGYNWAHAAWECFRRISLAGDRVMLPFMAALFVNKMAVESLNPHKTIRFDRRDPSIKASLSELDRAIRESKPEEACALVTDLAGQGNFSDLAQRIVQTAVQNDSSIAFGHDMKLCSHVLRDYSRVDPSVRTKTLTGLVYFLASLEKDYELYTKIQEL